MMAKSAATIAAGSVATRCLRVLFVLLVLLVPTLGVAHGAEDDERPPVLVKMFGSGRTAPTKEYKVAALLLQVKNKRITPAMFFQRLGEAGAGMKEVREVRTKAQGMGIVDDLLGSRYAEGGSPVEEKLMVFRRDATDVIIRETLLKTKVNTTIWVSKIGTAKDDKSLTIDGDIDLSFIAADLNDAKALKLKFDELSGSKKWFGLKAEAKGSDVVATAHGRATSEVYFGKGGQKFAEDMMKEVLRAIPGGKLIKDTVESMWNRIRSEAGVVEERSRLVQVTHATEPGRSMEMVRHVAEGIHGSREYPPAILVVKAAKYLERSTEAAMSSGDHFDPEFSKMASSIVFLSKEPNAAALYDFVVEHYGSDGTITDQQADAFAALVEKAIWRSVESSIRRQVDALNAKREAAESESGAKREAALEELRNEIALLYDTMEAERIALEHSHVSIPDSVAAEMNRVGGLVEHLKRLGKPINEADLTQKRLVEEAVRGETPGGLKMAAAQIYHYASRGVEKLNEFLDSLDKKVLGKLRGDRDFDALYGEIQEVKAQLASKDPKVVKAATIRASLIGQQANGLIAKTNLWFNETIQSSAAARGGVKVLMVVGFVDEMKSYGKAVLSGDWREFATELFRRRVPFGGATERIVTAESAGDYALFGWDLVTTLVPPIGLPQAAIGLGVEVGQMGRELYWKRELAYFVDEVYQGARFKPISSFRQGDAVVADWRLYSVRYRGKDKDYDLHAYADRRRDQIKAMAAELRKPVSDREVGRPLYGDRDGLTDVFAVEDTLRVNLAAADPLLRLLEEVRSKPEVAAKLEQHFKDQVRVRWEQVKQAFLLELIDQLETRWAEEWSLRAGQLPALFAELQRITKDLGIADEVIRDLDSRLPNNLSALMAWILAEKRDVLLQPAAATREQEAAGLVIEAVGAYRIVLEARSKLDAMLGPDGSQDGGLRILTGPSFLTGSPASDRDVAMQWLNNVERQRSRGEEELRSIKARAVGGPPEASALDTDYDRDIARKVWHVDVWRYARAQMLRDGKDENTLGEPLTDAIARLEQQRAKLIAEFEAHYRGSGTLDVVVVDEASGAAIKGARLSLGPRGTRSSADGKGLFVGIVTGTYELRVEQSGYRIAIEPDLTFPAGEGARNRRAIRVALAKDPRAPRLSTLTIAVVDADNGRPLTNADVVVTRADKALTGRTGRDGVAILDDLPAGIYRVEAGAPDYDSRTIDSIVLPVEGDGPSQRAVDVALSRSPDQKPIADGRPDDLDRDRTRSDKSKPDTAKTDQSKPDHSKTKVATPDGVKKSDKSKDNTVGPKTTDANKVGGKTSEQDKTTKPDTSKPDNSKPKTSKPQDQTPDSSSSQVVSSDNAPETKPSTDDRDGSQKTATSTPDTRGWARWQDAMAARDEARRTLAAAGRTAKQKADATAVVSAAEKRMAELWREAKDRVSGLPDFIGRARAEVERTYAQFKANGPKKAAGDKTQDIKTPGSSTVTDLDGNAIGPDTSCIDRIDSKTGDRGLWVQAADRLAEEARAVGALFDKGPEPDSGYRAAMEASDAMWSKSTPVGMDWKTKGLDLPLKNPCDGTTAKVTLPPVGPAKEPPAATAPVAPLEVALRLERSNIAGEIKVVAEVRGGTAPYKYAWTGARSNSGAQAVYALPVTKTPISKASLQVVDSNGATGSADIVLPPLALRLELVRVKGSGDVAVGQPVEFEVKLSSEGRPVKAGDYVLRWEPSTEAKFKRAEGAGVDSNMASWSRPGTTKVWVVALRRDGGALATVAESNQLELNIVGGQIALRVEPQEPRVGQKVTITASETPRLSNGDVSYWWEVKGATLNPGPTADQRVYTLIAKDTAPITVTPHIKEKSHGDELATNSVTFTPGGYQVSVVNVGPAFEASTARPVIWSPRGIATLEPSVYAPFQDIGFRADIKPAPPEGELRYRWSFNEGTSLTGNPAVRQTRAQRLDSGSIDAEVEIRDANDIVLGSGTTTVEVTVSAADLAMGKQKSAEFDRLKGEAEQAWASGKINLACDRAKSAGQIQPSYAQAKAYCAGRDSIFGLVRDIEETLQKPLTKAALDGAKAKLNTAKAVNAKFPVLGELEQKLAAAAATLATDGQRDQKRQQQLAQLLAGAQDCSAGRSQACRDKLTDGLTNADQVFKPSDVTTVSKAKQLLAKAEEDLRNAQSERQRRLNLLLGGASACNDQNWTQCRDKLVAGLDGGQSVFQSSDAPILDKARSLLSKAEAALASRHAEAESKPVAPNAVPDKQRFDMIVGGAQQCGAGNWARCKADIEAGLAGANRDFEASNPEVVAKAKALLAKANDNIRATAPSPHPPAPEVQSQQTSGEGHWARDTLTYFKGSDEPCPANVACATGWSHNDQGWERRNTDSGDSYVAFGKRHSSVQPNWSKLRASWQLPPPVLHPGDRITFKLGIEVTTPGWANVDSAVWAYRMSGVGGSDEQLGILSVSDASSGGSTATKPHVVPAGFGGSTSDQRLRYQFGSSGNAKVVLTYRWVPPGGTVPHVATPVQSQPAPQPRKPEPQNTRDGVYRGEILGLGSRAIGLTMTVSGSRITMVRDRVDAADKGHAGTIQPSGEFSISFPNNTYRGRLAGNSLNGTWQMERGAFGGRGSSGTLRATR